MLRRVFGFEQRRKIAGLYCSAASRCHVSKGAACLALERGNGGAREYGVLCCSGGVRAEGVKGSANVRSSTVSKRRFGRKPHRRGQAKEFYYPEIQEPDEVVNPYLEPETAVDTDMDDSADAKADEAEADSEEAAERRRRAAVRAELDSRTGRLWSDPWEFTDEDWMTPTAHEDLERWSPGTFVSDVSVDRVQLFHGGVPTLEELASMQVPPPPPPHPARFNNPKPYLSYIRSSHYKRILSVVTELAQPHIPRILSLDDWADKQDAIDELFETMQHQVADKEKILSAQPPFADWVERALEEFLRGVVKAEKMNWHAKKSIPPQSGEAVEGDIESTTAEPNENNAALESTTTQTLELKGNVSPIFMDLLGHSKCTLHKKTGSPMLVHPLHGFPEDRPGRMVEEWDLAAHKGTKRIMIRSCICDIARSLMTLSQNDSATGETPNDMPRVYVKGNKGAGKSATLAAVVASARASGHVVLYLPDGDRLVKHPKYVQPNVNLNKSLAGKDDATSPLLFDVPVLAMEVCGQMLECHENDIDGMSADSACLKKFLTDSQIRKVATGKTAVADDSPITSISLVDLLKAGSDSEALSSGCYQAFVDTMMNQSLKPFTVVLDEFNSYFSDYGYYFHAAYDPEVRKSIPLDRVTLFRPLLLASGVEKTDAGTFQPRKHAASITRGAVVMGVSGSHSVKRKTTNDLTDAIASAGVQVVDIPQYSLLEVEHILANFECIGIGRLRFDRGNTVTDEQEVAFLRMISGCNGQKLVDACIL